MMKKNQVDTIGRMMIVAGCLGAGAISLAQMPLSQSGSLAQSGIQTGSHPTNGNMPASSGSPAPLGSSSPLDGISSPFPDTTRQKRNDERQRRIVSDTQKLLTLTGQLRAELENTSSDVMSPQVIKQMEEIEKLAKNVKDKMRD